MSIQGPRLEGLEQGHATSCGGERPKTHKPSINDQGVMKRGQGKYYNLDPLYCLIGQTNETPLEVDGHKNYGLIDSGANISSISKSFAEKLGLPFRQLESLLEIEGSRGIDVPYLGYTEVNLKVPGVKAFNEDILVVIQNDSAYSARVPVALGCCI